MSAAAWICICLNIALAFLFFEALKRASEP